MIGRLGGVLLGVVIAAPVTAQLRTQATASTRLLDPLRGSPSPAVWLGLDLDVDKPRWGARLSAAGALGRDSWGGEGSVAGRLEQPVGGALTLLGGLAASGEHPLGQPAVREASARLGLGWSTGGARFDLGALGLASSLFGRAAVGGFGGARLALGRLRLQGEVGQLTTFPGSGLAQPTFGESTGSSVADTGSRRNGARRLGHGILGGSWSREWLELRGRLIRRSRLAPDDRMGWEFGVGLTPIAGIKLIVMAGQAPVGPSIYLPFRKQLTLGMTLVERRRKPIDPVADGPAMPLVVGMEIIPRDGGPTRIRFRHPRAARIDLVGDFTDWAPVSLGRVLPGVFELDFDLSPGVHLVNVRIDGGPLEVPAGLEGTDDGFGGRAGILVIR